MEVFLPGYWTDGEGEALKQKVLDKTGLWLDHEPDDVEVKSLTYFIGAVQFLPSVLQSANW